MSRVLTLRSATEQSAVHAAYMRARYDECVGLWEAHSPGGFAPVRDLIAAAIYDFAVALEAEDPSFAGASSYAASGLGPSWDSVADSIAAVVLDDVRQYVITESQENMQAAEELRWTTPPASFVSKVLPNRRSRRGAFWERRKGDKCINIVTGEEYESHSDELP